MVKGVHKYFNEHAWKNTELKDFVESMNQAYKESGDHSLGENFNLKEWFDQWLTTSGVNILEPVLEYNEN
jgi:aminopeptidase N